MSDNSIIPANNIPALMNTGFESFSSMVTPEETSHRRFKGRIEIPQSKGTRHGDAMNPRAGWMYIGGREVEQGKYIRKLLFLLIAPFTVRVPWWPGQEGRRTHKRFIEKSQGGWERDLSDFKPVCSSTNGLFPDAEYLGTTVKDIRTNFPVKIGHHRNGEIITDTVNLQGTEYPTICKKCPLGQWITGEDGRKKTPPCKQQTSYAIWVLPHPDDYELSPGEDRLTVDDMGLYYITGSNGGIQDALQGVKEGKPAAHISGRKLDGIIYNFAPTGDHIELRMDTGTVPEKLQRMVTGYTTSMKAKTISLDPDKVSVLQVPQLRNAPEGFPLDVGGDAPLNPVTMSISQNGFTLMGNPNPTLIPEFELQEDMQVPSEFVEPYLEAWAEITQWEVMSTYLSLNRAGGVNSYIQAKDIQVSNPVTIPQEDDIVDAEIVSDEGNIEL